MTGDISICMSMGLNQMEGNKNFPDDKEFQYYITECTVNGALAWVLRLSQIMGISPVKLESRNEGLTVRFSGMRNYIGQLLYGTYALFIVLYLLWEETSRFKVNAEYVLIETAATMSTGITALLLSAVTFKGPTNVKELINRINTIRKFRLIGIDDQRIRKMEKRRTYALFLYVCTLLILLIYTAFSAVGWNGRNYMKVKVILFCIGYTPMVLQAMRFVFDALMILSAIQTVNHHTYELLTDVKRNFTIGKKVAGAHRRIRHLADTYRYLCDALRSLNKNDGRAILFVSFLLWINLVTSEYIVLMCFRIGSIVTSASLYKELKVLDILLQIVWFIFHFMNILLLVEPCHRTYAEMQITHSYVSQIMYCLPMSAISGPLDNELEMFFRVIVTDNPVYSPFQMFILNRTFAVKIIAVGISYLAFVLQFQVDG